MRELPPFREWYRSPGRCFVTLLVCCVCLGARPPDTRAEESASANAEASTNVDYGQLNARIQAAIRRAQPACVAVVRRRGPNVRTAFSAVIVSQE
jgi:hypothetical protein